MLKSLGHLSDYGITFFIDGLFFEIAEEKPIPGGQSSRKA
jgi:hypothetical protein